MSWERLWIMLGAVALRLLVDFQLPKHHYRCPGVSKHDLARTTAVDIAYSAYPQWAMTHAGCPRLEDLVGSTEDPWGQRWQIICANNRVVVHSDGEDGEALTDDDIWSDRR